ncbi:hypothetical protein SESBI_34341 [Sesbania bispinosa]|nr:hypothetical protein SESBI_34341 [Sesbania bispinosa]
MEEEPWEGLDVDDSDLFTFLRPCNRHHSKTDSPLIPGPAGAVQAAMLHRRTLPSTEEPLPTQEFVRRVLQNGHDSDRDFNTNPWLSALQFVHSQEGMVDTDDVASATPLSSIKKHLDVGRVHQVVAVIKSCTPNGFGDMMVTLKDPTSTVGASIHRKVFTEGEFGKDITVGSAVVLQKVAVFSPTPSTCYMNITLRNIVKVFSKDSGPPSKQMYPACSVKRTTPTNERHEKFSQSQERSEGIMSNLRLDSRIREVADNERQRDEILVLTSRPSDNGNDRNQKIVLDRENLSLSQDNAGPVRVTCGG